MDAIDLNAGWLLVGHEDCRLQLNLPDQLPEGALVHYMTLVPMGVCYLTWFETLRRLPPSSASTGMLLVPLIGVISAALILGEPLGMREVVAMVLALGGVTLALQKA